VRPEVDEEEQDKDRDRSQRDGLQKAEKEFTESHSSIIRARVGVGDVTTRVDLLCRKNGWGGKTRARNAVALPRCYSGRQSFPAGQIVLLLAGFKVAKLHNPTQAG
jgi:hypothetical protein